MFQYLFVLGGFSLYSHMAMPDNMVVASIAKSIINTTILVVFLDIETTPCPFYSFYILYRECVFLTSDDFVKEMDFFV